MPIQDGMGDIVTIASHVWVDWIALWHRDRAKGFRKRVCFGHIARPGHSNKRLLFQARALRPASRNADRRLACAKHYRGNDQGDAAQADDFEGWHANSPNVAPGGPGHGA